MPILRKACTSCTKSKRKCIIQKPKCTRCTQKGLPCSYDLEPLSCPSTATEKIQTFGFKLSNTDTLGVCLLRNLKSGPLGIDPAVCIPGRDNAIEITRLGFDCVPGLIREGKPASFVHPKLRLAGGVNCFTDLVGGDGRGVRCGGFKKLIEIDVQKLELEEVLPALQALLVHLAASVFSFDSEVQEEADGYLKLMFTWMRVLLSLVDAGISRSHSPWQNWLLAESIRRTIFMVYALNISVISYKQGYCSNWLYMESLPFDARPGLWMAGSPQAWIAAAHVNSGEEVGECLKSYHEFTESCSDNSPDFCGDVFLNLVVFAHNGGGGN